MHCEIQNKDIQEITPTNIVQQTSFWAKIKYNHGIHPYAFNYKISCDLISPLKKPTERKSDDLLILVRHLNSKDSYAYVPYGPEIEPDYENHGIFLEELSECLKPFLPKSCIFIRYDLPWENQWAHSDDFFDENGEWKGPPPINTQELRLNINTCNWNLNKSPGDTLPTNTFFLNLKDNTDCLLNKMKSKTRYNIKLSHRKGVQVKEYGIEQLENWTNLYKETAIRNNMAVYNQEYFHPILQKIGTNKNKKFQTSLLMADIDNEFIAGMILILSKERGTYLYGASSSRNKNFMGSYAVQWEAIQLAKKFGCKEYDMFGAAPNSYRNHPLSGLYKFKSGFGGELFHRMGCWDYPIKTEEYQAFRNQEIKNQNIH
jgi:lipid II:glycine glycyltransferase (peptidoglycan interpeptide bridge formation enzyme)